MTKQLKPIMRKVDKATIEEIERIIEGIVNDISDRCGIGTEWNQMEYEIQEVIKDEWRLIIKEILDERV